ncbi:MAG: sugar phosphate isomerase/epimerase [Bacteroidetes bacterium]|nr:sugar phosphate isomerase/epimerase [Bacteroidota bacterium]MBU1372118.1 sugar phosphate isomerase/epimerase [Bacteroidota bacterium]MBU1484039.1 sugar phosphate isomerase/epimerase [Bacteroidota bacterium]MBU1761111.1 sugar phosphate isomerase/epimerase [Bacteroidota bacterium]MBU2377359.1 sugar phosphate isomerase/epimerase [Bacteroidota bacterium]
MINSRRTFLKNSALLSAGVLLSPHLFAHEKKHIGLQLYTVRDYMQKDPASTLAKVAKVGYTSVEGATYTGNEMFYGMTPQAFASLLKQNGLIMPSSHFRLGEEQVNGASQKGTILNDWERAVDDAATVGLKYMVCAYLSAAERGNLDHYKKIADDFNKAGETCKKAGIQLCYHNHDFEFIQEDGKYPYDILLTNTDKNLVKMEMDLYWITKAKQNPIALINKHPGRFPLWHVKDMDKTTDRMFTEVGNGIIDFKKIFKHADQAGLKYFFVEQDKCPGDPYDSITQSYKYIKANLV